MFQSDSLSKVATEYSNALSLIEVVLSVECCIQYQLVPLELFDNHLVVGMVNPRDKNALQNISSIVNSFDYSFHVQSIEAKTHQLILAAYLKIGSTEFVKPVQELETEASLSKFTKEKIVSATLDKSATLFDISDRDITPSNKEKINESATLDKSATLFDLPAREITPSTKEKIVSATLDKSATLFDLPAREITPSDKEKINESETLFDFPAREITPSDKEKINESATLFDFPAREITPSNKEKINESATLFELPTKKIKSSKKSEEKSDLIAAKTSANSHTNSQILFSEPQINLHHYEDFIDSQSSAEHQNNDINIEAEKAKESIETLHNLPPKQLWQKIINLILEEGHGRLNLRRDGDCGNLIYSQNEISCFSLQKLPLDTFKGLVQEIKSMAQLPIDKLEKSKKIAIKKIYNHRTIFLRIEFLITEFEEEFIIEVLSGLALQLYEQKQSEKTLGQAICFAKKLEKTVKKINHNSKLVSFKDIETLRRIVNQIENQLNKL